MSSTKKKSLLNILTGVLGQLITIAVGILLPHLIITGYGSETNGFLSSVNSMVTYLALLEAGVGAATVQALYGPIGKGDRNKINGVLSATNRFYQRTGIVYLACLIVLSVGYPLVVRSDLGFWLQAGVILLVGGGGVLSYFFQAKYRLLLQAEGKQYVIHNITTLVHMGTNLCKVVLALLGVSILWLQVAHIALVLIQIAYYAYYIRKHYGWIDLKVAPDEQAISQKNSVLLHQIAEMIFNHTDVLLLTLLTDLKVVSVYWVYSTLVDMISTLIGNINTGFVYKLGQLCNTDRKRFLRAFDLHETYYMAFSFALYCVTYLFLLPFMKLYISGEDKVNYLLEYLPVLFVSYKMMVCGRAACGSCISYAGHFKKTQWRAVLEAALNLSVSVVGILVFEHFFQSGIYGVLLGTIVAVLYRGNDMIVYANRHILERSCWKTYRKWLLNLGLFVAFAAASRRIPKTVAPLDTYWNIILWAAIATVAALVLFLGVNSLLFPKNAAMVFGFLKQELSKRRNKANGETV